MKNKIKKNLLIAAIAMMGLIGIKYSSPSVSDEDNSKKIEYARSALARIEQELASDGLNPEERHQLILTRSEIKKEIDAYSKKQNNNHPNTNDIDTTALTARLEFAQNTLTRIEQELKSDSLNPAERHELILTRTNVRQEIKELTQQLSKAKNSVIMPTQSHEK